MSLTPEQKTTVATWVAAGDNLSAVQKKLLEHFKITLTYRDVRFLVDDLELTLKDPAPKADVSDVSQSAPTPQPDAPTAVGPTDLPPDDGSEFPEGDDAELPPGEDPLPPADPAAGERVELHRRAKPQRRAGERVRVVDRDAVEPAAGIVRSLRLCVTRAAPCCWRPWGACAPLRCLRLRAQPTAGL